MHPFDRATGRVLTTSTTAALLLAYPARPGHRPGSEDADEKHLMYSEVKHSNRACAYIPLDDLPVPGAETAHLSLPPLHGTEASPATSLCTLGHEVIFFFLTRIRP